MKRKTPAPRINPTIGVSLSVLAGLALLLGHGPSSHSGSALVEKARAALSGNRAGDSKAPVRLAGAVRRAHAPVSVQHARTVSEAQRILDQNGLDLDGARFGDPVPRVFLAAMPGDTNKVVENEKRKRFFMRAMLPIILKVNEKIAAERKYLLHIQGKIRTGKPLGAGETAWLERLAADYRVKTSDPEDLLRRVDTIPPSLALAQSIIESGWGTSYFARRGNAMFGQHSYSGRGMKPRTPYKPGEIPYRLAAFPTPYDSALAYARNLNSHHAYREFREARAKGRRSGQHGDGVMLAGTLQRYSERGAAYIRDLRRVIEKEDLRDFDTVQLARLPNPGSEV